MRWLLILAMIWPGVIAPTRASGDSFGDWASGNGYSLGDAMPRFVDAAMGGIDSLDGIRDYDWTSRPTTTLWLGGNRLSRIELGAFDRLTNLTELWLGYNELTDIAAGGFRGLTNLKILWLGGNRLSSIEPGTFRGLANLTELALLGNPISTIEPGTLSGLSNLTWLWLNNLNETLTKLNFTEADFSCLTVFSAKVPEPTSLESCVVLALLGGVGTLLMARFL